MCELHHVIERAVLLSSSGMLDDAALALADGAATGTAPMVDDMTLEEMERYMLTHALKLSAGNISEAARRLGITRMAMRYRMQKYGLRGSDG